MRSASQCNIIIIFHGLSTIHASNRITEEYSVRLTAPIKRSVMAISELVTGYIRYSHGPRFCLELTEMSQVLGEYLLIRSMRHVESSK